MEDPQAAPVSQSHDVLDAASEEIERAEGLDDDARLAALDSVHARLSDELDKPAGDPAT
jgi:hypothetical protein